MSSFTEPDLTKSSNEQSSPDCGDEVRSQREGADVLEMIKYSQPQMVTYCPTCTMPPEYCEHGSTFDLCLPWIMKNCPEVLSDALLAKSMEQACIDGADRNDKVQSLSCRD